MTNGSFTPEMTERYGGHCGLPLDEVRHNNNMLVQLFSMYLNLMPSAITPEMVSELAAECSISRAEAYAQYLAAYAGVDAGGRDRVFYRYWLRPAIEELDMAPFLNDTYFKNIKIPTQKLGKWELKDESLRPLEAFVCRDFQVLPDGRMLPQIGFFNKEYPFPAVLENGREWMTLQPNEMVTTWPALERAHGRVLTFGLGLGYFTYHAAQKSNVESVTVVDISPDVISLFSEHILPQFPNREKITLIASDAFEFGETEMAGRFDFVFADIWHDAGDGKELYLRMKELAARHPDIEFTFWLEDTIRCYLNKDLW